MPPDAHRNLWQLKRKLGKSREYLYERAYAGGISVYIYAREWAGVGGEAGCPGALECLRYCGGKTCVEINSFRGKGDTKIQTN